MIEKDAEYMVSKKLNYYIEKIEKDTSELNSILMKAIRTNKSLDEEIVCRALSLIDHEIKNAD